jgi:hypothetical protein
MSQGPKDRAKDPKRVPPISFPLPSTLPPRGREPLRLDNSNRIRDRYVPGSQNPVTEMLDAEEARDRKDKLSGKDE